MPLGHKLEVYRRQAEVAKVLWDKGALGNTSYVFVEPADMLALIEGIAAERERCAKIVRGRVVSGHYREWPEYGPGNRHEADELVKFSDALATAIES